MKNTKRFVIIFLGFALLMLVSYISNTFSSTLVVLASEYECVQNEEQPIMSLKVENATIDNITQSPYLYHPSSTTSFDISPSRDSEIPDVIDHIMILDELDLLSNELPQFHIFRGRYIFD